MIAAPARFLTPRRALSVLLFAVVSALSCGREPTGLHGVGRSFQIALNQEWPEAFQTSGAGNLVPFTRVRVVLRRADGTIAFDQLIDFPANAQSIEVPITVSIAGNAPATGEPMSVALDYVNAAGQVVFTASSTVSVPPAPPAGSPPPPPVTVNVTPTYVGPGANATRVAISPPSVSVLQGGGFSFTAQAFDASNNVVPNTPIVFSSSNPAIATISAGGSGAAGNTLGTATITAALITGGTSATGTVTVTPRIAALTVTGGGQTAEVGATLPVAISARVVAVGNLPMAGVAVTFSPGSGGTATPGSATTGADGVATATWKLGTTPGSQSMTVTATGLAPTTITATATQAPATKLVFTAQPAGAAAGASIGTVVVTAQNAASQTATNYTGAITLALSGGGTTPGTLGGSATASAVAGVATFSGLTVSRAGAGYILTATGSQGATPLTPATSAPFTIGAGTASKLVLVAQPTSGTSDREFPVQPIVEIQDANGTLVTDATNTVTVSGGGGNGVLGGTTSATAVAGIARFTNLKFTGTGTVTLQFTSAGLTSASGAPFSVAGSGPSLLSNPALIDFTAPRGGANPARKTATLTSSGGPITNIVIAEVRYTGAQSGWLTATVDNVPSLAAAGANVVTVTTPAVVTMDVATGTLPLGRHEALIDFTSSGVRSSLAVYFTITPLPPTQLVMFTEPANAVSGLPIGIAPVVELRDANNGRVDGATNMVTAAIASGPGTLSGTTTVAAFQGRATFNNLRVNGLGTHTLTFTSVASPLTAPAIAPVTSASFNVTQAPASLAVVTQPSGAVSGNAFGVQPVVEIRDNGGVMVVGATNQVTATITSGNGTLVGTSVINAVNGTATFTNLQINGFGPHTISFTGNGVPAGTSTASFTVTQVPTALVITTAPTGGLNGGVISPQPVVQIRDAGGVKVDGAVLAVTAAIATGPGGGAIGGTTTVNAVNGIATFTNVTLSGVGTYTLQFSTSTPALTVNSAPFNVTVGAASQLAVTTQPGGANSGSPFGTQPVVEVRDAGGVRATSFNGSVTVAKQSGSGTLLGTQTVTAIAGVATFTNLQINGGGSHTLIFSASLPANPSATVVSGSFTVTQVAMALAIQTQPAGAVSGVAFATQPVVRIVDAAGLTVVGATNSVSAAINTGTGSLSGTTTVAAVNGIVTFAGLTITGTGCHSLAFSSISPSLTGVNSQAFGLGGGSTACGLVVGTQPSSTAGSGTNFAVQPSVQIKDGSNATVTGSTASVTVALASGTGTLSGTTTVAAVAGVATFSGLKITGTGPHTLIFTSPGLTSATSNTITVSQVNTTLLMTTQPGTSFTGAAISPSVVVTLRDAGSLGIPGVTVTASKSSGAGTLSGTLTAVTDGSGVATFANLIITGTGAHVLTFAVSGPSISVNSASFAVNSTPPSSLTITTQPSAAATSGVAFATQPVITLKDALNNNVVDPYTVVATLASGTGALAGTTSVNSVGGVATFTNLRIDGAGAHTIQFAIVSPALNATSSTVTVTQVPASLQVQTQPAGAATGTPFTTQPVVRILDNAGLVVQGATNSVVATIASGPGTLGGGTTIAAANGVATFVNLAIVGTGNHSLQFAIASPALSVTSGIFAVTALPPTAVTIQTQPSAAAMSGVNFAQQPVIELRDANTNLVTQSITVTASLASGTGTLAGTTAVTSSTGTFTFTNLKINGPGAHTIKFEITAGLGVGLFSTSGTVTVGQQAASLVILTQPAGSVSGVAFTTQPVVRILDNAGILVTTGTDATLMVTAAKATGTGALSGTTGIAAVGGVATFTNLVLTGSGGHTLSFSTTSPALSVNSASITPGAPPGIVVNVSASATATMTNGAQIAIPLNIDMSNRGTLDLASLTVSVNYDATKFTFVSTSAASPPAGWSLFVNSATPGVIGISGFRASGTDIANFTFITFTLQATATAAPTNVTAGATAAGNELGSSILPSVSSRSLAVTINP